MELWFYSVAGDEMIMFVLIKGCFCPFIRCSVHCWLYSKRTQLPILLCVITTAADCFFLSSVTALLEQNKVQQISSLLEHEERHFCEMFVIPGHSWTPGASHSWTRGSLINCLRLIVAMFFCGKTSKTTDFLGYSHLFRPLLVKLLKEKASWDLPRSALASNRKAHLYSGVLSSQRRPTSASTPHQTWLCAVYNVLLFFFFCLIVPVLMPVVLSHSLVSLSGCGVWSRFEIQGVFFSNACRCLHWGR